MLIVAVFLIAVGILCFGISCDRMDCNYFDSSFKYMIMSFVFLYIGSLALAYVIILEG